MLLQKLQHEKLGCWHFVSELVPAVGTTSENLSELGLSLLRGFCPTHIPVTMMLVLISTLEWESDGFHVL